MNSIKISISGHCGCPSSTSLPGWLSQPPVGVADATELEAMALPSSDANSIALKEEALLANFHQRFKKDYIYVSLLATKFITLMRRTVSTCGFSYTKQGSGS